MDLINEEPKQNPSTELTDLEAVSVTEEITANLIVVEPTIITDELTESNTIDSESEASAIQGMPPEESETEPQKSLKKYITILITSYLLQVY